MVGEGALVVRFWQLQRAPQDMVPPCVISGKWTSNSLLPLLMFLLLVTPGLLGQLCDNGDWTWSLRSQTLQLLLQLLLLQDPPSS